MSKSNVLLFDIETFPMEVYCWGLYDQNIGLNQLKQDWTVASWSAKWLDKPGVMYDDLSRAKNNRDDKKLLEGIWKLLDEADVVITQNGKSFDSKKLNARFIINGMKPPSPYRHIDTKIIAKKVFGFTSNSLEYMTNTLGLNYKKLKHKKFPGFELWAECMKGNKEAWAEMKKYNQYDVLALEDLYKAMQAWDQTVRFEDVCNCGKSDLVARGFSYTNLAKYQRYRCRSCGAWSRGSKNLVERIDSSTRTRKA